MDTDRAKRPPGRVNGRAVRNEEKMPPKQVSTIATKIVEISKLIKPIGDGDEFEGLYMHDEVVYSLPVVGSIIAKLTEKTETFSSQKEFTEWIEELKLS